MSDEIVVVVVVVVVGRVVGIDMIVGIVVGTVDFDIRNAVAVVDGIVDNADDVVIVA